MAKNKRTISSVRASAGNARKISNISKQATAARRQASIGKQLGKPPAKRTKPTGSKSYQSLRRRSTR